MVVAIRSGDISFNTRYCEHAVCVSGLQLGLMEEEMHSAVETATAAVDDVDDDEEEIEKILHTASTTGKPHIS